MAEENDATANIVYGIKTYRCTYQINVSIHFKGSFRSLSYKRISMKEDDGIHTDRQN